MPCVDPFSIRPIERNCVCPPPARGPAQHTNECNAAYKAALFVRKQTERDAFYGTDRRTLN